MVPRTFNDLRDQVANRRVEFPRRLSEAVRFLLSHPDDVAFGTTASLAASADLQPSTLTRLAHHLGYFGFRELQEVFREHMMHDIPSPGDPGHDDMVPERACLGGFVDAARASLSHLREPIDLAEFERCAQTLAEASAIFLLPQGGCRPFVAELAYVMAKLGIRAMTVAPAHGAELELLDCATKGDAILTCETAPGAWPLTDQFRTLSEKGISIVALAGAQHAMSSDYATHRLVVAEPEYAGFRSLAASMAVATALAVATAERRRRLACSAGERSGGLPAGSSRFHNHPAFPQFDNRSPSSCKHRISS